MKRLIKPLTVFFLGFSIFVAIVIIALYIATPIFGERKADIERIATQFLHQPVKIESSKGVWLDTEPVLMLKNVTVFDENSMQPALKIPEIQVGFKILASLWQKKPVVGYLYVDGARIRVEQDINNKITIRGLSKINQQNAASPNLSEFFDWINSERKIKLDHIVIDWQKPDGKLVTIPYFAVTLQNSWGQHLGNLKLNQADIGALLTNYDVKGWKISSGMIDALNLHWGWNYQALKYIKGSVSANHFIILQPSNTAPQPLPSSSLKKNHATSLANGGLAKQHPITWQSKSLATHFLWRGKINDQWMLKLQRLQINLDGQDWVEKTFQINSAPIKKGGSLYTVHASNLHLANLWAILTKLTFLSKEQQELIKHLNPRGDLKNIYFEYPYGMTVNSNVKPAKIGEQVSAPSSIKVPAASNVELLPNWKFAAEVHELHILPWQKIPGIEQLSGYLQLANGIGQFHIDSEKLRLTFLNTFRVPLFFEHAQANIDWQIFPTGYKINAADINVDNVDAKFHGDMSLWLPQGEKTPFINLFGEFTVNPNAKISSYLPVSIMKPNLIKWLDQAFPSINGGNGNVVLRGPLKSFPFPNKEGIFSIHSQLRDTAFQYYPGWPVATHLFAKLNFDGPKMSVFINSGKIFENRIKSAYGEIPIILNGIDAKLNAKINLVGDLRDGVRFILQSPLNKKLGSSVGVLKINGDAETKVNLDINLENDNVPAKVRGNIDMSETTVTLPFKKLAFENVSGVLHFTQDGLETSRLKAEFLYNPITLKIQNDKNTQTLFQFSGKTRVADLEKALDLPKSTNIEGNFNYRAKLVVPRSPSKEQNQLLIASNLKGIKLNLPAPFGKLANDLTPSQLLIHFSENQPPTVHFNYTDQLKGILEFHTNHFDFYRGNIAIGDSNVTLVEQPGLWVTGSLAEFNWEEWKKFFHSSNKKNNAASNNWPSILKKISLEFKNIQLFEQNFQNIRFDLSRTSNSWLLGITNPNIVGRLIIPDDEDIAWNASFEKLFLSKNTNSSKSSLDPRDVPRLSFFARNFHYGNKQFGQVQMELEPLDNGLKVQRLTTQSPAFSLNAQGHWQAFSNHQYTNLIGTIVIRDIGHTLTELGMPPSIVGKDGKLVFNLEWPNSPYDPVVKALSGSLSIALDNGRIVDIGEEATRKIGIGQLLNFFSLQNLPRHLTLDFSDVSKQGFPFDTMRGNFMLKNGNAYTKDTYWDGPVAYISMKGKINLANENYDLFLDVSPHITSSLPVVATLAGGPVVGLTTWVADKLLSKQVGKLITYSYHMSGPWSKPALTQR